MKHKFRLGTLVSFVILVCTSVFVRIVGPERWDLSSTVRDYHDSHGSSISMNERMRKSMELDGNTLKQQFNSFFNRNKKIEGIREYLEGCASRWTTNTICAMLESRTGFGAVVNNALNTFVIALEKNIQRRYCMLFGEWSYAPLHLFFEDIGSEFSCRFFEDFNLKNTEALPDGNGLPNCTLSYSVGQESVMLEGSSAAVIRFGVHEEDDTWQQMREVILDVVRRDGIDTIFRRKSLMLQAIWSPKPEFKKIVFRVWRRVIDSHGRFFAVHIRRGDKLTKLEMKPIETSTYFERVEKICYRLYSMCPRNILLMSDDAEAISEFTDLARGSFKIITSTDAVSSVQSHLKPYSASKEEARAQEFQRRQDRILDISTAELIINLTLMSMADRVVCTHSSNICRLVALLKGDMEQHLVHSLDVEWALDNRAVDFQLSGDNLGLKNAYNCFAVLGIQVLGSCHIRLMNSEFILIFQGD